MIGVMTMLIFAAIFAAFFLSSFPVLAADGVPVLDVKQTCQGAELLPSIRGRPKMRAFRVRNKHAINSGRVGQTIPLPTGLSAGGWLKLARPAMSIF